MEYKSDFSFRSNPDLPSKTPKRFRTFGDALYQRKCFPSKSRIPKNRWMSQQPQTAQRVTLKDRTKQS